MSGGAESSFPSGVFFTPPPKWETPRRDVPVMPRSESTGMRSLYHVRHKVPPANSPYGIAKNVQLVDKDPSRAVSLFWAAINSGDRVDSALKDMAVIMKQLNRSDEAIEAIKSFRHLCPTESQESLDNILLELYKRSGKLEQEIQMLQVKLMHIEEGISFSGKRTKVGRSQGKKVHITIEKEYSRLLGNLAWAFLQQKDYRSAEEYYRKSLSLEPDKNKQCNLAICLMHLNKMTEAKFLLQTVRTSCGNGQIDESFSRSFERATKILGEFESDLKPINQKEGMYGEIHEPFSSHARRNSRVSSQTANTSKLHGSQILKGSSQIHGASSLLQNFHESNLSLSGSKRNTEGTLSGGRRLCTGIEAEDSVCMHDKYDASFSLAKIPRVLYTQPQKCSRWASKANHRSGWYAEESNGSCSRKLLFQHEKNGEDVQCLPCHDIDKDPESARSLSREDSRKNMLGDPAKMNGDSSIISISIGVWERDFLEIDEQKKDTKEDGSNLGTRINDFPDFSENCRQNSTSLPLCSTGFMEVADYGNQIQKSRKELKTNLEYLQGFSTSQNKKSWADMVEEDDQELLNERRDLLTNEQEYPSQESVLSPRDTSNKYSDDAKARKQFADENRNSNIILEAPCSLNQCESLSQKIESLILGDGYYTQPLYADSSINQISRQLLYDDQYGNPEKVWNSFVSPLRKRSLNFARGNPAPLEEHHTSSKDLCSSRGKG